MDDDIMRSFRGWRPFEPQLQSWLQSVVRSGAAGNEYAATDHTRHIHIRALGENKPPCR